MYSRKESANILRTKMAGVLLFMLFLPAIVFAGNWDSMVWDEDYWSILEIRANGQIDNVTVSHSSILSITVQLNPGEYVGTPVDWWVVVNAGSSWYYMDSVVGWTQEGAWRPVHQGPLFNLPPTEVLNISGLGAGLYTFYFAVDYPMDGILNLDGPILVDAVNVTVQ
jgi:hypothetical protein